jgi:hypothetical protein
LSDDDPAGKGSDRDLGAGARGTGRGWLSHGRSYGVESDSARAGAHGRVNRSQSLVFPSRGRDMYLPAGM